MDDPYLEEQLRATAPRLTGPSGLTEHRQRIMSDLRARRRRLHRLWTGTAVVTIALIGGGTVAVAGNGMETPWGWTADNVFSVPGPDGKTCFAGIRVTPNGLASDSEVLSAAREIVAAIDLRTLDTAVQEAALAAQIGKPYADGTPGTVFSTPQEIKQSAVFDAVADITWHGLEERGLPTTADEGASLSLSARSMGCS